MTQFASVNPEHFEGTIEYECRIHGEECYGCVYEAEWEVPFEPTNRLNPILVEFRRSCPWDVPLAASREAEWLRQPGARPVPENATGEQIEHARKVLTRLANLEQTR